MESLARLVDKLCDSSKRNFHNIYDYVEWPESVEAEHDWFMSPELCSLHGTEVWDLLEPRVQKRIYETVKALGTASHAEVIAATGKKRAART